MTAEQLVVLALLVAAFAAGWFARGSREGDAEEEDAALDSAPPPSSSSSSSRSPAAPRDLPSPRGHALPRPAPRPAPASDAARALALAAAAFDTAVDRWLDERDEITPAGRAAVGEVERAVQRLDGATARLDEADEAFGDVAYDALEALREGARLLAGFREGRVLDAATSRELDRIEDAVARARATLDAAPA